MEGEGVVLKSVICFGVLDRKKCYILGKDYLGIFKMDNKYFRKVWIFYILMDVSIWDSYEFYEFVDLIFDDFWILDVNLFDG